LFALIFTRKINPPFFGTDFYSTSLVVFFEIRILPFQAYIHYCQY
jgi:hypothetical protein